MIYVIAKCPCHEEGASKLIDFLKSDDGFSVLSNEPSVS